MVSSQLDNWFSDLSPIWLLPCELEVFLPAEAVRTREGTEILVGLQALCSCVYSENVYSEILKEISLVSASIKETDLLSCNARNEMHNNKMI